MNNSLTLYKFRSLNNFEFIADIILNKQFYAAQFFDLNDPMEGFFRYDKRAKNEYINDIVKRKKKLRICSFSHTYENILMWAHYADGFKGVCFEVKVQNESNDFKRTPVTYNTAITPLTNNPIKEIAQTILSQKNKSWSYEKEIRTLSTKKFIKEGIEITAILLGQRIPEPLKNLILKLTEGTSIEVWNTKLDTEQNEIIKADRLTDSH
jgi:hypothetical protein